MSPQELRQALHPGRFVDFVDESSRQSLALRDILKSDKPDFRMRDAELLVRYYAFSFFISKYTGNLKSFLDATCKHLNEHWEEQEVNILRLLTEFENAHIAIRSVFGVNSYRKWTIEGFENRFNRAIFDVMLFVFRVPEVREILVNNGQEVVDIFKSLCEKEAEFLSSIEQTTKSITSTHNRLSFWVNRINNRFGTQIAIPNFI